MWELLELESCHVTSRVDRFNNKQRSDLPMVWILFWARFSVRRLDMPSKTPSSMFVIRLLANIRVCRLGKWEKASFWMAFSLFPDRSRSSSLVRFVKTCLSIFCMMLLRRSKTSRRSLKLANGSFLKKLTAEFSMLNTLGRTWNWNQYWIESDPCHCKHIAQDWVDNRIPDCYLGNISLVNSM